MRVEKNKNKTILLENMKIIGCLPYRRMAVISIWAFIASSFENSNWRRECGIEVERGKKKQKGNYSYYCLVLRPEPRNVTR